MQPDYRTFGLQLDASLRLGLIIAQGLYSIQVGLIDIPCEILTIEHRTVETTHLRVTLQANTLPDPPDPDIPANRLRSIHRFPRLFSRGR